MLNLGKVYQEAVKWMLRYFKEIISTVFCLEEGKVLLEGLVDVDLCWGCDISKSIFSFVFNIDDAAVSWMFRFYKCVFL